jgi:hypothetical protein
VGEARVSSIVANFNKEIHATIEAWRNRPIRCTRICTSTGIVLTSIRLEKVKLRTLGGIASAVAERQRVRAVVPFQPC